MMKSLIIFLLFVAAAVLISVTISTVFDKHHGVLRLTCVLLVSRAVSAGIKTPVKERSHGVLLDVTLAVRCQHL